MIILQKDTTFINPGSWTVRGTYGGVRRAKKKFYTLHALRSSTL